MIDTKNILIDSLEQTLETMAFLTIEPLEEDMSTPERPTLAEISFTGPINGTIQILAGLDFCKILAENIGAITEVDNETCYDALKELSNVTSGLLLPLLSNSKAEVFDITIPTIKNGNDLPTWNEFVEQPDSSILNVEGNLIAARLILNN
ncbi:MAG: chemotaxis protein CheX [Sedimentisphaerales bacterium]|nr:chemotaxis protein CheX [Sedimentisphaerales bacterium]